LIIDLSGFCPSDYYGFLQVKVNFVSHDLKMDVLKIDLLSLELICFAIAKIIKRYLQQKVAGHEAHDGPERE
jgi:hypothetical protein